MTLKEYLEDYASEDTKKKGIALIKKEIEKVTNPKVKERALENLAAIENGSRDFRF
jgi:2-iminoacetate synthase